MNDQTNSNDDLIKELQEFSSNSDTGRNQTHKALFESEEKYRMLLESSIVGVLAFDIKTHLCTFSNASACKIFGYSGEEIIRLNLSDFHPQDSIEKVKNEFESQGRGEKSISNNLPCLRKDGTIFYADIAGNNTVINGRDCSIGFIIDVTERIKAEKALSESEEKYRILLNGSSNGILAIDAETHRFLFSNPSICKLFGYSDEEFKHLNIENLIPKESLDIAMAEFEAQMRGEKSVSFSIPCQSKDGRVFYSNIVGSPVILNGRRCNVGFFMDVTEQIFTEQKIRVSEETHRTILQSAMDGFMQTDLQGQLIEVNETYCHMSGYSKQELLSMNISDLEFKEMSDDTMTHLQKITVQGGDRFETLHRRKDGSIFDVEISVIFQPVSGGRFVTFLRDITDLKQSQQDLLNAKEKAEKSDRLKTAFMNNISHEIRTPLNSILGFSQLMADPDLTRDEREKYLTIVKSSSKRLINTVTDFMDMSLIASGNQEVQKKLFAPGDLLSEIYNRFQLPCKAKKLTFTLQMPPMEGKLRIHSDHEMLLKVVSHLVDNAVKFTKQGTVSFGFEKKGNELEFFVKDTGVGIIKEIQPTIFDTFMQENASDTRGHEGSGLGLPIAKGFAELLGGRIRIESSKGEGSAFFFTLPIEMAADTISVNQETVIDTTTKPVILIAEDEPSSSLLLERILHKEGIDILVVNDGQKAVASCRQNPLISLVLMDIKMPVMDGFEATKEIKSFNPHLPVIALTAFAQSRDKKRALDAGCSDVIDKPFEIDFLFGKLKKYGFNVLLDERAAAR